MMLGNPAVFIDHTLLKAGTTAEQVRRLCEEAVEYGFASVCLPPVQVPLAAELLYGSEVAVGTVVGFPLGYVPTAVKVFEASEAVAKGAQEIDMVIQLWAALEGHWDRVESEIRQVVRAAETARVKVILECCYLNDEQKQALTACVVNAGADYVKTSTGFGPGGATLDDVVLLVKAAAGRIGVKAAGGIRDLESCRTFLQAGAGRIGTSAGTWIVEQWRREQGL
ncbi:MAG: deoxyribose-phosphate aldolase [Desulfuromonadaceae bacterium]